MIWTREEMDRLAAEAVDLLEFTGEDPKDLGLMFAACYGLGAAVAFGIVGMFEAIRANTYSPSCSSCGFDGQSEHPNTQYDRCLYRSAATKEWYCGECADHNRIQEDLVFDPDAVPSPGGETDG